jgi:hypothetical protein
MRKKLKSARKKKQTPRIQPIKPCDTARNAMLHDTNMNVANNNRPRQLALYYTAAAVSSGTQRTRGYRTPCPWRRT